MATIKDVAKLAGVSVATVSRVLNSSATVVDHKRDAVARAMQQLDYQPSSAARALVSSRSGIVGLVLGDLADPFFGLLMKGVESVASDAGLQVIAASGHHDMHREEVAIRSLLSRKCEALVVHSKALSDERLTQLLKNHPGAVIVNRLVPDLADRCFWFDNRLAGEIAVEYLLSRGHRKIGWLGRNEDLQDNHERFEGVCSRIKEAGLGPDCLCSAQGAANEQGGYKATMSLLHENSEITAFLAYNDAMAAGCLSALHDTGKQLPDECSVMGIDDVLLGRFVYPRLTTVSYPVQEIGRVATQVAVARSEQKTLVAESCFKPELVLRDSVADAQLFSRP